MPKARRKKARKKARKKYAKKSARVSISAAALRKVVHLGASHHAALKKLRATASYKILKRKKSRKKTGKKRARKR
jgi:hypothetical protein